MELTDKEKIEFLLDFIDYSGTYNLLINFITNQFPLTEEQSEDWLYSELDTRDQPFT